MRHSAAHLMASAVSELYPEAKFGVGPVVENGFYYDIGLPNALSADDLQKIEEKMREIKKRHEEFVRKEMPIDEAIEFFRSRGQDLKVELLTDLKTKGSTKVSAEESFDIEPGATSASVYETGSFVDLCRGPHVKNAKDIGAFKLTKIAGAYWRGKEGNPMLQRIYGLAFAKQKELDEYLVMIEEAEKRDHRKLGRELDLFTFSEFVGPGLPLWTPRGTLMRNLIDEYVWELRRACGYERVEIPHITKKDLYERSGHWEKFKDELFRITTREGHEFVMKPMNCPHHTQIYARKKWSYRELPQRYANTTMVYRDEQSGELAGLSRVRSITQDDAHVFCRMSQFRDEAMKIWDIIHAFYGTFGIKLDVRLSLSDPDQPEKYLGDPKRWKIAEDALRDIVSEKGIPLKVGLGEAAFYGPKLDFMGKDAIGREHQVATIQLDLVQPERFELTTVNELGEDERIVMVHAAIAGSLERFLTLVIEQYAGTFPVWLSPVQVAVIPVGESHIEVSELLAAELRQRMVRTEVDRSNESVGKKIRTAEMAKVPYAIVVGDKEAPAEGRWSEQSTLAVRQRGQRELLSLTLSEFLTRLRKQIHERQD